MHSALRLRFSLAGSVYCKRTSLWPAGFVQAAKGIALPLHGFWRAMRSHLSLVGEQRGLLAVAAQAAHTDQPVGAECQQHRRTDSEQARLPSSSHGGAGHC